MTWVENNRDPALAERFIEDLVSQAAGRDRRRALRHRAAGPDPRAARSATSRPSARPPLEGDVVITDLADEESGASTSSSSTTCTPRRATRWRDAGRRGPRSRSARTRGRRCRAPTTSARSASATAAAATRWWAPSRSRAASSRARTRDRPRRRHRALRRLASSGKAVRIGKKRQDARTPSSGTIEGPDGVPGVLAFLLSEWRCR